MRTKFFTRKKFITTLLAFLIGISFFTFSSQNNTKQPDINNLPSVQGEKAPTPTIIAVTVIPSEGNENVTDQMVGKQEAVVVRVIDGDTVAVAINGKKETIRIIGINTPETVDPRKTVECFGKEASDKAKELLTGKTVYLEKDPSQDERDKYQRLLRFIWIDDTTDYGKLMITNGYAYEYTYQIPYKYQNEYKAAQKKAENEKKGLWADNACIKNNEQSTINNSKFTTIQQTSSQTATGDKDCKDFKTHVEAQNYFVAKGGNPTNNVDRLDSDEDGVACESLP